MKIRTIILSLLCSTALAAQTPAQELLDAAMSHHVTPETFVYNWRDAVLLKAFTDIYRDVPSRREAIGEYVLRTMERVAPKAYGLHPNAVAPAFGFAFLEETGASTEETRKAAARVFRQYMDIMRTVDGACSHRARSMELWDDSVYMLEIFLLGMYRAENDPRYLDECIHQILAHALRLEDPATGLWYHGWAESICPADDEMCVYGWNTNPLHRSGEFWGRGNGWVAMALADLLEAMPADHRERPVIERKFRKMMATLSGLQDRKSRLWYQLPAVPKAEGNYLESSGSAMFAFAMAKGARLGILPQEYVQKAERAYTGLCGCISKDASGVAVLGSVCEGTCIGDREYYLSRKTSDKETYAVGAFLMLANQLNKIQ